MFRPGRWHCISLLIAYEAYIYSRAYTIYIFQETNPCYGQAKGDPSRDTVAPFDRLVPLSLLLDPELFGCIARGALCHCFRSPVFGWVDLVTDESLFLARGPSTLVMREINLRGRFSTPEDGGAG